MKPDEEDAGGKAPEISDPWARILAAKDETIWTLQEEVVSLRKRRIWPVFGIVVEFAAVGVAIAAIFISAHYQRGTVELMRGNVEHSIEHDHLSLMPHLQFSRDFCSIAPRYPALGLYLSNLGSGPALIVDYDILLSNVYTCDRRALIDLGLDSNTLDALARYLQAECSIHHVVRTVRLGSFIAPGERVCLLGISQTASEKQILGLIRIVSALGFTIPYKSLYGDLQTADLSPDPKLLADYLGGF